MKEKEVRKAFSDAEKELKEKQIAEVKKLVLKTLEKLEQKKQEKKVIDNEIRILRMDIDDLKLGKLERIAERQDKDDIAKNISVAEISKEKVIEKHFYHDDYWYEPYRITWGSPQINYLTTNSLPVTYTTSNSCLETYGDNVFINNSTAKEHTIGTYKVLNNTIHLR